MTLYRANPKDGVAWITGGSSGLGRALAKDLANQGYAVAVTSLPEDPADTLVVETAQMSGHVKSFPCDVTDELGMARTAAAIEEQMGPIVLAVFNAGNYIATPGENLVVRDFHRSFAVNYFGIVNGVVPVVEHMRVRGRGHIVLVGSVTAYSGWPTTAAYGGTKAAINILAESLKYDFDKMNIRVQVINPGFIDTPLTEKNKLPMPGLMPVHRASRRMARGIRKGGFEVTFPYHISLPLKVLGLLPRPVGRFVIGLTTHWWGRPLHFDRRLPGDKNPSRDKAA
ncbi:SDR family NAD(P)-dependent oxidoreductase [Mesorhizobium sp. CA18]|uniref:SDR family NAD(P)-dependent oxidoreductase n=1 Tax=unclassified Mesorhizobium TaxID=325217 RepID=UPI001CD03D63|nr:MULTISPECIES: SDR family NAD(P)-dependent oxidoreductase [unclassified Mesorhizobium]MBZ9735639.1 SDR family NAD(P)-dependent oxidoreductase [Mesorhizobium sp. CA9]MBZ9827510.1 SDR family NAD(P)-dependent oxidoreductase [Mesorhizobium sp. CA18]MBZ9833211.1 SDR family NAD(P)-dependent oxidoreductase [Mesorhizobium sp. CA2]MBZ9838196.1 SDR family NAD(P)-dependent oxidoreductase [Mesorhizobium sp. CA3]MBZ9877642.1 SDR family NAD(P)-dependent oxidoreductase [Mesorhizobium sp. Ca11]